jgi:hypothetical protein
MRLGTLHLLAGRYVFTGSSSTTADFVGSMQVSALIRRWTSIPVLASARLLVSSRLIRLDARSTRTRVRTTLVVRPQHRLQQRLNILLVCEHSACEYLACASTQHLQVLGVCVMRVLGVCEFSECRESRHSFSPLVLDADDFQNLSTRSHSESLATPVFLLFLRRFHRRLVATSVVVPIVSPLLPFRLILFYYCPPSPAPERPTSRSASPEVSQRPQHLTNFGCPIPRGNISQVAWWRGYSLALIVLVWHRITLFPLVSHPHRHPRQQTRFNSLNDVRQILNPHSVGYFTMYCAICSYQYN